MGGTRCIWLRIGAETSGEEGGSCEHSTGILSYIKGAEFGDQLRNFQNLKDILLWSVDRSVSQTDRTLTTLAHHINPQYTVTTERQSARYKRQLQQSGRRKHLEMSLTNYKHVRADIRASTLRFAVLPQRIISIRTHT